MKRNIISRALLLNLFVYIGLLEPEGFSANTYVYAQHNKYISIEQLIVGDKVFASHDKIIPVYPIMHVERCMVNSYVEITIGNCAISVACDQKFYVPAQHAWVNACQLVPHDKLLCCNDKRVSIDAVRVVHAQQEMYVLSVDTSHIFCVTPYRILAHNAEPIGTATVATLAVICPPAAAAVAVTEIIALGIAGIGAYLAYKKSQHNKQIDRYPINNETCSCGGKPPKHEDDKEKHPHGIYEDAGYHHQNSTGGKSTCPKNGQRALDNSFEISGSDRQRIALDEDQFVVLYQSSPGRYHGHVRQWERLDQAMRNTLVNQGLVRHSGKIIRRV